MSKRATGKRVGLYLRVSTTGKQTQSLKAQQHALVEYVQRRRADGWIIPERGVFKDSVSGTKDQEQRPGLKDLVQAVHRRTIDVVLVTKLDRLARSLKQLVDLCEDFREHGVDLVVLGCPPK